MFAYLKYIVLIFALLFSFNLPAQLIFYQNMHNGGVTGGGFTSWTSNTTGYFDIYIEPNSTIKQAFLFASMYEEAENKTILLNGNSILLSANNRIGNTFTYVRNSTVTFTISTIVVDVTNVITPSTSQIEIVPPQNQSPNAIDIYSSYYLIVIYENANMEKFNHIIGINDKNTNGIVNYHFDNLNTIDTTQHFGLCLHAEHHCNHYSDSYIDGSFVKINNDSIGLIYGKEINNHISCGGVRGDFYYQNHTLTGLGDDIANNTMDSTDAIAVIESYIDNLNEFDLSFEYESLSNPVTIYAPLSNVFLNFFLTYTTSCDTFSTALTDNVSVCKGEQVQLEATGGIAYEWLPQVGLSCYNCPNPVATADAINYYTCRIWNTDSCSKVLPVKINIIEPPQIQELTTYATTCGDTLGHVNINAGGNLYYNYILNDTLSQPNPHIYFLPEGNHIVSVVDTNGCRTDSTIYIASINNVSAQFSATPQEGEIPVEVNFSNQSTGATHYIWYIGEDTLYSENATYLFETGGEYNVTLVAIDNYPFCSDTATQTITAITPFYIFAPTLTEKDGISYEIKILNTSSLTYALYNELGQLVYNQSFENLSDGMLSLWDKSKLSRGIYFFTIVAKSRDGEQKEWSGKVVVF